MLKVYCQDCGSPTSYTSLKPKFCSSCGKPFNKTIVVNKVQMQKPTFAKPQNIKNKIESSIDDDYEDAEDIDGDIDYVPDINKIDIEISDIRPTKIKMGDIISHLPEDFSQSENLKPIKNRKTKASIKKNQQKNPEFLNQFKSEAGTLRPSYRKNRKEIDG